MAPATSAITTVNPSANLFKRVYCTYDALGPDYCYSGWYYWGRWVVLGVIILFAFLILLACSCTARRRRRRGVQPFYGTGWMAPSGKYGQNQHQMNNYPPQNYGQGYPPQEGGYYNPPPAYGQQPQNTGTTFNPNDGYYGQAQYGVQQPQNTYQRDGFSAPEGPPPGK